MTTATQFLAIDPTSAKLADSFSPTTWPTDNGADLILARRPSPRRPEWVFSAEVWLGILRQSRFGGVGARSARPRSANRSGTAGTATSHVRHDGCARCASETTDHDRAVAHGHRQLSGDRRGTHLVLAQGSGTLHALDPATGPTEEVAEGEVSRFAAPALSDDQVAPTPPAWRSCRPNELRRYPRPPPCDILPSRITLPSCAFSAVGSGREHALCRRWRPSGGHRFGARPATPARQRSPSRPASTRCPSGGGRRRASHDLS
jgi:hypothetical protein